MNRKRGRCTSKSAAATLALLVWAESAQAQNCERFQTLSLEAQSLVLASNDRSDPECTAFLLKNLGDARYEPAARTVVKYLDFEWQKPQLRDDQSHLMWYGDFFPAFQALYSIGEKSSPVIIEYLGSRDFPPLERQRAVMLVVGMGQPRMADLVSRVQAFVVASRAAGDPVIAGRLWRAANEAAAMCGQPACQAALTGPTTK